MILKALEAEALLTRRGSPKFRQDFAQLPLFHFSTTNFPTSHRCFQEKLAFGKNEAHGASSMATVAPVFTSFAVVVFVTPSCFAATS